VSELKSTLELVLEKTRNITTTPEEKEQIKKQEYIDQATILLNRYLSREERVEDLVKALAGNDFLVNEFLSLLWDKLNIVSGINPRVLEAITLFQKDGEVIANKLKELEEEYQREREEKLKNLRKSIIESLAQRGIKGSAVIPNPEGSQEGKGLLKSLEEEYEHKLRAVKESVA
jgi:hypothetical protein